MMELTDSDLATYAKDQKLTAYEFLRLTEFEPSEDDVFVVTQAGVSQREYDDQLLSLLTTEERNEILEGARHRLEFPCSPAELVAFVEAVSWYFDLPERFIHLVRRTKLTENPVDSERGCRRLILENWKDVVSLYGPHADGRQVSRTIKRNLDSDQKQPTLKTVQNRLAELRKEGRIP